jgi:2-C-methyl-D-erythritol 4-phosphate cytidylyltransferase
MAGAGDKLFLTVAGRPVIAHSWALFESMSEIHEIVLVIRDADEKPFREVAHLIGAKKPFRFAPGGPQRQDSVWSGLQLLAAEVELVAIHDGARPCTSINTVKRTLEAAKQTGAAVAASRITDTIKEEDGSGRILRNVERSRLWSVQTPQAFRVEVIRRAMEAVRTRGASVTDDTAACELIGQTVELVESRDPNPKVTVPADLEYVELLLRRTGPTRGSSR